jgi:hypothetical protein
MPKSEANRHAQSKDPCILHHARLRKGVLPYCREEDQEGHEYSCRKDPLEGTRLKPLRYLKPCGDSRPRLSSGPGSSGRQPSHYIVWVGHSRSTSLTLILTSNRTATRSGFIAQSCLVRLFFLASTLRTGGSETPPGIIGLSFGRMPTPSGSCSSIFQAGEILILRFWMAKSG